jgi:glycosyltransferase involved in cell wall biosynthesis
MPTFNNGNTLEAVINDVLGYSENLIVVNDGSTDNTGEILKTFPRITVINFETNRGKGSALREGLRKAASEGFDYALTMDSDGQHFASDIPAFVKALENNPEAVIVGARNIRADGMPAKNTFANNFSNFWFKLETGISLPDTQSGFRLYPLAPVKNMKFFSSKYEFEVEILVRLAWKDIPVTWIPVKVYYPPENERVSHFRPLRDFSRISVLNTFLVLILLLWIWPRDLYRYFTRNKLSKVIKEQVSINNETPAKTASAVGFGLFMGILPVWGFQMLLAAFFAHLLKLNKVVVLVASNISIPPMIPFIVYFSYRTGGVFLHTGNDLLNKDSIELLRQHISQGDFYQVMEQLGLGIWQYVLGSIILGLIIAFTGWITTWFLAESYVKAKKLNNL